MKTEKTIGILLIAGALGVLIPYTMLTIIFDYPDILREEPGSILIRFKEGGNFLILTWWAFAILGLPLLVAYTLLGQIFELKVAWVRWATTLGLIGLMLQMIGLLRWTFVVPILAQNFGTGNDLSREASIIGFQIIHQYGGVVLGEHIGQLFTIIWTVMLTAAFQRLKRFPIWITVLGYTSSVIYSLAQLELFATVMPETMVLEWAGFAGSTLWILWLLIIGVFFLRKKTDPF